MDIKQVGRWSFAIGFLISIGSAFIEIIDQRYILSFLFLLGLLVGYFNINHEDIQLFLTGVIFLIVFGIAGIEVSSIFGTEIGNYSRAMLRNFVIFAGASGLVIARKAIFIASGKPKIFEKIFESIKGG